MSYRAPYAVRIGLRQRGKFIQIQLVLVIRGRNHLPRNFPAVENGLDESAKDHAFGGVIAIAALRLRSDRGHSLHVLTGRSAGRFWSGGWM